MEQKIKDIRVELARGEEDWGLIRECFVRAFHRYSLYTFLIPNEQKRPAFLRQYLDAIYDVTVRNGSSLLLAIIMCNNEMARDEKEIDKTRSIIGGVLFVPASEKGGWQCAKDEDFAEAYERYNLAELDKEAMENIKRYENWEYDNVTKHIINSGIPMWNGVFCAIDPPYAGLGCGSLSYTDCISSLKRTQIEKITAERQAEKILKSGYVRRFWRLLSMKKASTGKWKHSSRPGCDTTKEVEGLQTCKTPLIVALTHGNQAVKFHKKNGFRCAVQEQYPSSGEEKSPFDVHVLLMDPFNTGKIDECITLLQENYKAEYETKESNGEIAAVKT